MDLRHPAHAAVRGNIGTPFRQFTIGSVSFGWWWAGQFGSAVPEHQHDEAHIIYPCTARYYSQVPGLNSARRPMIFNPAGTIHSDHFESPGLFFSLRFERPPEETFAAEAPVTPACADSLAAGPLIDELVGLGQEPQGEAAVAAQWLAAELMQQFRVSSAQVCRPAWLGRVEQAIRDTGETPRLALLAREAGVHPFHLARTFRRAHGCTPARYARNLRVERALASLTGSRMPIVEIAAEHGFADQSHFTRAVSARFGMGPARLRRQLR
jgi:AraC family transcriptional regulator